MKGRTQATKDSKIYIINKISSRVLLVQKREGVGGFAWMPFSFFLQWLKELNQQWLPVYFRSWLFQSWAESYYRQTWTHSLFASSNSKSKSYYYRI